MSKIVRGAAAKLIRENDRLKKENADLRAKLDYIALCDYPEMFEDEESEDIEDD